MKSVLATTLGLLPLITASAAYGQSRVLPVPLIPQVQTEWCWAASGQMIFSYLGAPGLRQCDEANMMENRTDCCGTVQCSTDADCNPDGGTSLTPDGGCSSGDDCIPPDAPMCDAPSDCPEGKCTKTPAATAAGRTGQCRSQTCVNKECVTSVCAGGTCGPPTCNQGSSTQFSTWGFNTQTTTCTTLSFSALQAEIDANRPVEFWWAYGCSNKDSSACTTSDCGNPVIPNDGHVLVAIGYNVDPDAGPMVYVNDPWPVDEGTQYWLTYTEWLGDWSGARIAGCPDGGTGCSGVHYNNQQWYGIQDNHFCRRDNDGLAASSFQQCLDYQFARGRSPVTINAASRSAPG
jgi:hypothetical protein